MNNRGKLSLFAALFRYFLNSPSLRKPSDWSICLFLVIWMDRLYWNTLQDKKAAQEKERDSRIAEAEVQNLQGVRHQEGVKLAQKLAEKTLQIKEISSDGHCMYRAVEDQLTQRSKVHVFRRREAFIGNAPFVSKGIILIFWVFPSQGWTLLLKSWGPALLSTWGAIRRTSCPSSATPPPGTRSRQASRRLLCFTEQSKPVIPL